MYILGLKKVYKERFEILLESNMCENMTSYTIQDTKTFS